MKKYSIGVRIFLASVIMITLLPVLFSFYSSKDKPVAKVFTLAEQQYSRMLEVSKDYSKYPRGGAPDGSLRYVSIKDWTGGFWPGSLWYVYEYNHKEQWKEAAIKWTESLEANQYNTDHHDIGFMMNCSYGNAYRITGNEKYKAILVQSARSLCKRFSPVTGAIQSWGEKKSPGGKNTWQFPVIIDNMMNLELLFLATQFSGDSSFYRIAVQHAETTMKNQLRPDYSCYHVVNYDKGTGKVLHQQTAQGYADNSTWSRGQAWGVYGFTLCYRATHDKRYLETAQHMADFFLDHPNLPADKIPYWDFNANQPGYQPDWNYDAAKFTPPPRDAAAASIICSALFELSGYSEKRLAKKYRKAAFAMLHSLSSDAYLASPGTNSNFLLKHGVGNIPGGTEIDVPLVYADYYFLEALLRSQKK